MAPALVPLGLAGVALGQEVDEAAHLRREMPRMRIDGVHVDDLRLQPAEQRHEAAGAQVLGRRERR